MKNYIGEISGKIQDKLNDVLEPRLLDSYALLVLTKGEGTTLENVHDAWSAWCNDIQPSHRGLIPFDQLSPEAQELDRPFMDTIREVAEELAGEK